ncbi:MAG: M48 family metallopeptidase [bacterium]|nr:M48 family metallopeptidase [bacterium]
MASLYSHQESNIRRTWFLFTGFLIVVIGLGWFFSYIFDSSAILIFAVIFSVLMSLISYWQSDKIVLAMARAIPVERKDNPELYNIVENLAITAGLPTPKIYLVNEASPNAFATGRNPQHSVIAVTSGLLAKLNRAELEGVIAHELSHVGNRDILLSTAVVVLVGFVSLISNMFIRSMFWNRGGRRNNRNEGGGVLFLIGIIFAILAPIAAALMQLAISRKREFLADASGSLLTRYPEGLAQALEKISQDPTPMKIANNTTSHLWIENPFKGKTRESWFTKLFMTHPPVKERIKALREMSV